MILVPKEKLDQLTDFAHKCQAFAGICRERVTLLEEKVAYAEDVIADQEEQVYVCKEDLESEKKKQSYIIPGVAAIVGILLGFFIAK